MLQKILTIEVDCLVVKRSRSGDAMKYCFDLLLIVIASIVVIPIVLILSAVVYLKMGRPVFFVQTRVGKNNKIFKIIKFRTMLNKTDDKQTDEDRLTPFGKFLRSTSLDELPELWNVVRGEMSLVGPRPLLVKYITLYSEEQARRHHVRSGITGWAQINGRNAISWDEKFKLDVWYVDNHNLLLDLNILFSTVFKIFRREGISAAGEATMPEFTGPKKGASD